MKPIVPFRVGILQGEYCSQTREPPPPIHTIEEGVKAIEKIVAKEMLCKHDVQEINQTYAKIDLLQRKIDPIPEPNTTHVLQTIIAKVDTLLKQQTLPARTWIYLYHLQHFVDPMFTLKDRFTQLWETSKSTAGLQLALAQRLPYCESEDQFKEDIQLLFGSEFSPQIANILHQKESALQRHKKLKIDIEEKKRALKELRRSHPKQYPPYLDQLLEEGYLHLYTHLLEMGQISDRNRRRSAIETIPFSSLSHIILETREAIIRKVKPLIPEEFQKIVFLIGGSGAGKSTTLCFLRGDRMVLKNFQYESIDDKGQIIGLASAVSCTFLPTIEVCKGWVIVDFPGFDDSNGPLISIGMEFALKALLAHYNPLVLVVESITNIEGRFAAAAKLGLRLARLIENPKDCLLGITKYIKDPDYNHLKMIEETQRKELDSPSVEETFLGGQIQAFTNLHMPQLQPNIDQLQQQLKTIRDQKQQQQNLPLPETKEKQEIRKRIAEREEELLKQIGLNRMIPFNTLDSPQSLASCLAALETHGKSVRPHHSHIIDSDHERLLDDRFEKNLKDEILHQEEYIQPNSFQEFESAVLESSLINTIFCKTQPEIGQLLHAPEIDPRLARKYDQAVVGNCIKKCISETIKGLNMSLIDTLLKESKPIASGAKLIRLERLSKQLRDYVLGLLGAPLPENQEQAAERWKKVEEEQKSVIDGVEKSFALPGWATVLLCLPIGIPYGIRTLYKWSEQSKQSKKIVDVLIDQCCTEIEYIQQALVRLKDVEKIIQKQEEIDQAFASISISLASKDMLIQSMQNKISAVRSVYGAEEWDKRVGFLEGEFMDSYMGYSITTHHLLSKEMIAPMLDPNITFISLKMDEVFYPSEHAKYSCLISNGVLFLPQECKEAVLSMIAKNSLVLLQRKFTRRLLFGDEHIKIDISDFSILVHRFAEGKIKLQMPLFRAMMADVLMRCC